MTRAAPSAILLALVLAVAGTGGCGNEPAPDDALEGLTRDVPLQVGELIVPEVDADGTERDYSARATAVCSSCTSATPDAQTCVPPPSLT